MNYNQPCSVCLDKPATTECPDCALIMCEDCLKEHECDE